MLETEVRVFADNLPQWLENHLNRVVLIHGETVVGFFDDESQAIAAGARQFGLQPVLVRRIVPQTSPVSVPALAFGLIRANSESANLGASAGA